jgi:hypothetical protein
MCPEEQIMKIKPRTFYSAEKGFGSAINENLTQRPRYCPKGEHKIRKRDLTPSIPPKTDPGAKNMKTRPDALSIAENESESAKLENKNTHPRYRRK